MTFCNVTVKHAPHPLQRLNDSGIFDDYIAVMMSPSQIVWAMVKDAKPKFFDVEQV